MIYHYRISGNQSGLWMSGADEPKFKLGAVVRLNSGGPSMTVIEMNDDGLCLVNWFSENELCFERFPPECLTTDG